MKESMVQSDGAAAIQPRVLFKPGSWLENIDFINHSILFNNTLVTVLSEKEGGKTSFSTLLHANLNPQIKSIFITAKPSCSREDIISEIAAQLSLDGDALTDISSITTQINERKSHVLLLVDDAQFLPESLINEAILALKNQESLSFFHLCFVSDTSIVTQLNNLTAGSVDNFVHTIELGALNESETRTYVLQRAMATHLISKPLTETQFKHIYQLTKGNVAKINNSLEEYVFQYVGQKKKNPLNEIKKTGIAASIVFITGFMGFYFSQSYDIHSFFPKTNTTPAQTLTGSATVNELQVPPKQLVSYIASWQDSSTRQLVYASFPTKQALGMLDDEIPMHTVAIIDKVVVIPKVQLNNPEKAQLNNPVEEKPKKIKTHLDRKSKLKVIPKTTYKKPTKLSKANLYTIQVAASHNKKEIELFKRKNKILAKAAKLRHFTNANGVWYVLTIGEYENKSKAQNNLNKLPTTLGKLKPWVRTVSSFG